MFWINQVPHLLHLNFEVRNVPICTEIRVLIIDYYNTGKTITEISKKLKLSKLSVHDAIVEDIWEHSK